jgi:hypothetical protein
VLDVSMAEIHLQGTRVGALVGKLKAAGVSEHVWVGLEAELGLDAGALDHASEACSAEGCSALRREHEGRPRLLLALKAPQGSQLIS